MKTRKRLRKALLAMEISSCREFASKWESILAWRVSETEWRVGRWIRPRSTRLPLGAAAKSIEKILYL